MKQGLKTLATASVLALSFQHAEAETYEQRWAKYDLPFDQMAQELLFAECYTHQMIMTAEDKLYQKGDDETQSPENMLLFVFGRYARGVYLEQYRALKNLAAVKDPTNAPQDVMKDARGPVYNLHEDFIDNARKFATMVGIDESAVTKGCEGYLKAAPNENLWRFAPY